MLASLGDVRESEGRPNLNGGGVAAKKLVFMLQLSSELLVSYLLQKCGAEGGGHAVAEHTAALNVCRMLLVALRFLLAPSALEEL